MGVTNLLPALALACASMVLAEAQNTTGYRMAPNKETTQVDFLANYYSQDGDFGAPQGGPPMASRALRRNSSS